MAKRFTFLLVLICASPAFAQDMTTHINEPAAMVISRHPPVTAGDIIDRPYRVLSPVRATVRKLTILDGPVSQEKVYKELWERAARIGADAVIFAEYAAPETELGRVGAREADGRAIKFLPAEPTSSIPH